MLDEKLERVLKVVQRPARYIGGEWNVAAKEPDAVRAELALCYPDVYELGMASFDLHLVYGAINGDGRFACERAFSPWVDMAAEMRREGLPLYTLESRRPVAAFDVVGFWLDSELRYTNVLETLDLAGLPVLAEERGQAHPLVVGFGPCVANPEPLADFFDLFVLGEVEEVLLELLELAAAAKAEGAGRAALLSRAAQVPGIYLPAHYTVAYKADGVVDAVRAAPGAPAAVRKRMLAKLGPPPTRQVVPHLEVINVEGAVELQRGCGPGCPRCEVGAACDLVRRRPAAEIVQAIDGLARHCGYQEVSLLASGALDPEVVGEALRMVRASYSPEELTLTLPAMPADPRFIGLADLLAESAKRRGYTLTPVAATERLRGAVLQPLAQDALLATVEALFRHGWGGIRYHFTVGLPTETVDDVRGIAGLVLESQRIGQRVLGRKPRVRLAVSLFVPRPHTLFQQEAQEAPESLRAKLELLRQGLKKAGAPSSLPDPEAALLEATLAMGDRRVGRAVLRAWRRGCSFDGWSQGANADRWAQAFEECGLSPAFYAHRRRGDGELLPWSHLDFHTAAPAIA